MTKPTNDEVIDDLEPSAEDADAVRGGEHAIVSPRDAASGLPKGKRLHKPLTG